MKKIILTLVLVFSAFTFVACGNDTDTDQTGNQDPIQIAWFSDGNETAVMNDLLAQYKDETGIEFELLVIAYDQYENKLNTMISGGNAPALARVTEGHLTNFVDDFISLDGVYTADNYKNKYYNPDGELISLPMDVTANGLFVNLDLLNSNSVNYPTGDDEVWTWDEFYTEMSKLNNDSNVAAPGIIDNKAHRHMPLMVYQAGEVIWDEAFTTTNLTSDAVVAQTQRIMDYYEEGFFDAENYSSTDSTASLFRTGVYGFYFSGNWNVSSFSDADNPLSFNWGVLPMPTGANGESGTILGGKSLGAFEGSGYEQEAKDFIEWFAAAEQHDYYTENVPFLSPRVGSQADYGDLADAYSVFLDEIANTPDAAASDWLLQVQITGMYGIINPFAAEIATNPDDKTALQLLQELEAALIAGAAVEE